MGSTIAEVGIKALAGGLLVLVFAALSQTLSPKRFAGILSAAPSVALAGLVVTVAFTGVTAAGLSMRGMVIGAVGFVAYCLAAVPLCRRLGTWRGSSAALVIWGLVAGLGYLAVFS